MSGAIRVLHVDDEPEFAAVTATVLERNDERFSVETATSPQAGLDCLAETDVDCIVSDYDMPGLNGIEFLQAVRKGHPELPFLLFTGKGSEEIASEAISAGVTDYLRKGSGSDQYTVLANRIESAVDKHRTERELDATRRQYKKLVEQHFVGIYIIQNGEFVYVNPKLAEIHGYDRDEIIGMSPLELVAPEERDRVQANLQRRLDGEVEDIQYQTVGLTSEGERIDIGLHGSRIEYEGSPAVIGAELDISERKDKERELERLKERFQAYVENTSDVITVLDGRGTIQYQSPSIERVLGYEPDAMIGDNITEYLHPDDRERVVEQYLAFTDEADSTMERIEYRFECANGDWVWLESVASNQETSAVDGYVVNSRDITDRKARESQLQRFRQAVEHAGYAVFITDTDGTIEYVNPEFEAITGYSAEDAIGRTPGILSSGEMSEKYYADLWGTILGGAVWSEPIVNQRKSGERYHVDQTIAPIVDDGEVTAFVAIQADVTERKAYERELERQNEHLEEFATVISHDLRNPLNVADIRLELAREDRESDHLAIVDRNLDRIETMIEDLLGLARSGEALGDLESIDLAGLCERCWDTVATETATLECTVAASIRGDSARVQQLLENLYRNAVEHGSTNPRSQAPEDAVEHGSTSPQEAGDAVEHGSTSPRSQAPEDAVEHGSTSPQQAGDAVEHDGEADVTVRVGELDGEPGFYVEDDGPGIPEADRETVFERGYTTADDGNGFGLRIVERIVDAHGWTIRVTEGSTGGARFEIADVELDRR